MGRKIKAALIDMDGVLYDSVPNHARAWMRVMTDSGIPAREEEFFLYEGRTGASVINEMIQRTFGRDATEDEKKDLYALKAKHFVAQGGAPVMPFAQEFIQVLRNRGINTVLVTGSGQNSLLSRLDDDYPGAFPATRRITSASVTHGKPHPEPYLKGLELAGVDKDEAIVFDNAPLGTASGHSAGMYTVGIVTGPLHSDELYKTGADFVFNSMEECAKNVSELLDKIEQL